MCYWPSVWSRWLDFGQVLFCIFIDQDKLEANKNTHKKTRPIYSHLDRASLLNKGLIIWQKRELLLVEPMQEILNWQDEPLACSGSQSKCRVCIILSASCFSHACIIRMHILSKSRKVCEIYILRYRGKESPKVSSRLIITKGEWIQTWAKL